MPVAGVAYTIAGSYTGQVGLWDDYFGTAGTQALLNGPQGQAVDAAGDLLIARGNQVDKLTPAGLLYTVAGRGGEQHLAEQAGSSGRRAERQPVYIADTADAIGIQVPGGLPGRCAKLRGRRLRGRTDGFGARGPAGRAGVHFALLACGRHSVPLWDRCYSGKSGYRCRLCRRYLPGAVPYCRLNAVANANSDP